MPQIPITVRTADDRPLVKVHNFAIPDPEVGLPLAITVPLGYRYKLASLFLEFNTDANIADRFMIITISTPAGTVFRFTHLAPIINGETRYITLAPALASILWSVTNMTATTPIPTDLTLEEGSIINVAVTNIQVGDFFTGCCAQLLSQFIAE